mgnify:CR=1 FL=1
MKSNLKNKTYTFFFGGRGSDLHHTSLLRFFSKNTLIFLLLQLLRLFLNISGRNVVGYVALLLHASVVFATLFAADAQRYQELITTLPEPPGVEKRIDEGV